MQAGLLFSGNLVQCDKQPHEQDTRWLSPYTSLGQPPAFQCLRHWLPSQRFPLSAALQRAFSTSASSEAVTPIYLSHSVLEIAMTLSNVPEHQAQGRQLRQYFTYFIIPLLIVLVAPFLPLCCSTQGDLGCVCGLPPHTSLALLLSYCTITSSPVSSSESELTFLYNGDASCLFCWQIQAQCLQLLTFV